MSALPMEPDVTTEWLHHLYEGVDRGWLTLFALDRRNGQQRIPWREVDDIDGLVAEAAKLDDNCCVWFGVGTRKERCATGRGTAKDVELIPALWVDIDIEGPNHKGENPLPKTLDEAWDLIAVMPLPPTAVVVTGGGLQPWWFFKEPISAEEAAPLLALWGYTWAEFARRRGWHVDNVFDLARVMRLPGTHNRKEGGATPVRVVEAVWDRRFNVSDIESFLLEPPADDRPEPKERLPYIGPERPGDAYNAVKTGADVLEARGFTFNYRDQEGNDHYTRPGKDKRDGASATVYADGHTTIWSDAVRAEYPAIETKRPYDPFGLYTAMEHDGDFRKATEALLAEGYGSKERYDSDLSSWVGTGGDASAEPSSVEWDRPVSLGTRTLSPFPIDVLPSWIADYCLALADEIQVPVDLCAQVALGAWATACAGKVKVAIVGKWSEHVNLFLATAMSSGGGKSPVSKRLTAPLRSLEDELIEASRSTIAEAKAERKKLEKDLTVAEKAGDTKLAASIDVELSLKEVPRLPRLVVDDVTQEKLSVLLAEQKGRIALISTEATMFDLACGLYSSKAPNNSVYLQGWSSDPLIIDRKGASSAEGTEIKIAEPVLTVAITVQPSTIAELRKHPELHGRGFTARFMYSIPASIIGKRDRYAILRSADTTAADVYEDTFLTFARRFAGWLTPAVITFSEAAAETFVAWMDAMEPLLDDDAELTTVREWSSKLHSSVARLAGLLHMADGLDHKTPLSVETMQRAIRVGEYWVEHALAIAAIWDGDEVTELARAIVQRRFVEEGIEDFDSGAIHQSWHRERLARMAKDKGVAVRDVAFDVLSLLEEHGYIRTADGGPVQRMVQGKARQRFIVNPLLRDEIKQITRVEGRDNAGNAGRPFREKEKEILLSPSTSLSTPTDTRVTRVIDAEADEVSERASTSPAERPPGWSLIGDPDDEGAA